MVFVKEMQTRIVREAMLQPADDEVEQQDEVSGEPAPGTSEQSNFLEPVFDSIRRYMDSMERVAS